MRRGWVRVRGLLPLLRGGAWMTAVNFEAMDGTGEGSLLLKPGWLGQGRRGASCCGRCEAVLVDPKVAAPR